MISLLKYFLPLIGLWVSLPVISSVVDTVEVRSKKMNRDIPCVVITPDRMTGGFRCPVLYLLHGIVQKDIGIVIKFGSIISKLNYHELPTGTE